VTLSIATSRNLGAVYGCTCHTLGRVAEELKLCQVGQRNVGLARDLQVGVGHRIRSGWIASSQTTDCESFGRCFRRVHKWRREMALSRFW
jgi:hypothetical protein